MPLSQQEAERLAKICLKAEEVRVVKKEELSSLWGGMGRVYRVTAVATEEHEEEFVVKHIDHASKACRLPMSDKRKVIESYQHEANFYQFHSQDLRTKYGIAMPKSLHVESSEDNKTTVTCMSVLQPIPAEVVSSDRLPRLTVEWLATFHASTWKCPSDVLGSYWHYDTRPNVWKTLSIRGLEGRLKRAAKPLDQWLNKETSLQSWIHGDCKRDNVLWEDKFQQVALCDFQYVGRGCPCKDLAYFLADIGSDNDKLQDESSLVDFYFEALSSKLSLSVSSLLSRPEFDVALELAYCDYLRFLCAWRGQNQRQKERLLSRVEATMDKIDGGTDLGSENSYQDAILKFAAAAVE